jgi:hypothetical protein
MPDTFAHLAIGLDLFFQFASDSGAIDHEKQNHLFNRCLDALKETLAQQREHLAAEDDATYFLSLLGAALASGRAHIAKVEDGGAPSNESFQAFGWRDLNGTLVPRGDKIGWINETAVYLQPDACFAVAQRMATDQGKSIPVNRDTIIKRLVEKGLIIPDKKAGKNLQRITIEGPRRYVLQLASKDELFEQRPDARKGPSDAPVVPVHENGDHLDKCGTEWSGVPDNERSSEIEEDEVSSAAASDEKPGETIN